MAKRLFDLVAAAVGLALLSPLFLGIALWVRFDSPGPALYRQERVGRFGRLFRIHKFRTMSQGGSSKALQITVGADPRITRAGRVLRRLKLDELPQLWDVLVGDMSLVGPRPEVPKYVALYPEALRDKVLSVRPGITDPVSLRFVDESALLARAADPEREYVEVVMPQKLAAAAMYAEHATLASDLRVIGQTLHALLFHHR
ncbi:MAG TPA: sugar transferase [Burkholderiaceae bacterium]|nr:sugar transferase [Burkholderiaceae bacterium]